MSTLVLIPDPDQPGRVRERLRCGDADTAVQRSVLLWPAEQTSVLALQLPPVPPARLRAALAGALEDRLLDDPQSLQLALAPASASASNRLVVVCARAPLQQWLRRPEAAAAQVVPEFALLQPGEAWLQATDAAGLRLLWRDDRGEAGWCRVDAAAGWPLPALAPQRLLHDAAAADAARLLAPPGCVTELLQQQDWLQRAASSDWDLRQFELAPQDALQAGVRGALRLLQQPRWRALLRWLALLLLIQLFGLDARAWQMHRTEADLQQQMQQVLMQVLPGTSPVVAPQLQLRRALDAQRARVGLPASDAIDTLFGVAAGLLPSGSAVHGVHYAAGVLELQVDAAAADAARQRCAASVWRCGGRGGQLRVEVR